jgi:hypothetical protein
VFVFQESANEVGGQGKGIDALGNRFCEEVTEEI